MSSPHPDGLLRSEPSRQGVSSGRIVEFLDDVREAGLEMHGLLVWRDGTLCVEGFCWPYGSGRGRILHSITKSFLACAIGLLIDEERLELNDRVYDLFPEITANRDRLEALTIEDLLTMRTGHGIEVSGALWRNIETSWIAEFFEIPVEHPPGTRHVYSSAASYMLSAIVTRVTGKTVHEYLQPRLLEPLGITDLRWDIGPDGFNSGGNGITAPLSAALKLGILHVRGGRWEGRQLLSAAWVARATLARGDAGYGYHWVVGREYFAALGVFVQAVFAYPADDAVIAVMGAMEDSKVLLPHLDRHFPLAFREPPTPSTDAALAARLQNWAQPATMHSRSLPGPKSSGELRWIMDHNPLSIRTISLEVRASAIRFTIEDASGRYALDAALDGWLETTASLPGADLHHGYRLEDAAVVAGAQWLAPANLWIVLHFVESAFRDTIELVIEGDRVRMERRVNINSGARMWPTLIGKLTTGAAQ